MNCVILDDEPFAHKVLSHYISQHPALQISAQFRNAVEAFEYVSRNKTDLLFLDIEMPLVNGLDFLKALKDRPKTIFTTAYKEYAFEGFELGVVDYLLKPFSFERFQLAVEKAMPQQAINPAQSPLLTIKKKRVIPVSNKRKSGISKVKEITSKSSQARKITCSTTA